MPAAGGPLMHQPMAHDPFYASNSIAAPPTVQMAAMAQHQQAFMMQQQMMMMGQQPHQSLANPFGNPYGAPMAAPPYGSLPHPHAYHTYRGFIWLEFFFLPNHKEMWCAVQGPTWSVLENLFVLRRARCYVQIDFNWIYSTHSRGSCGMGLIVSGKCMSLQQVLVELCPRPWSLLGSL